MPTNFLSQIDVVDSTPNFVDSFWTSDSNVKFASDLKEFCSKAMASNKKQRNKLLNKDCPFVKTFDIKGVFGIAGLCTFQQKPIVFKTSVIVDDLISHEHDVGVSLNSCRNYCPHFANILGNLTVPISLNYIDSERMDNVDDDDSDDVDWEEMERLSLWNDDSDTVISKILFYEYVSDCTVYKAIKHYAKTEQVASAASMINMVLAGLQFAQDEVKFSHYDLHIDNILIRPCPKNMLFLYKFADGTTKLIQSHGVYPVLIDFGNSYSQACEGKAVRTTIANYKNGFQPTIFDPIVDVHHFLLSTVSYLETLDGGWYRFQRNLMNHFGNIPLWLSKGWKKLPYNLFKHAYTHMESIAPEICESSLYMEQTLEVIDILVPLTICPWKPMEYQEEQVKKDLTVLFSNIETIHQDPDLVHDRDSLVCLKALVDLVRANVPIQKAVGEFKTTVSSYYKVPKTFPVAECLQACKGLIPFLTNIFYMALDGNKTLIDGWYDKTVIKRPLDAIKWVESYASQNLFVDKDTKILVMDAERKTMQIVPCPAELTSFPDHPGKWKAECIATLKKQKII